MFEFLRFTICNFVIDTPLYVLCCVPFFFDLRVKKRTVITMILITGVVMAAGYSLLVNFVPEWRRFNTLCMIFFYIVYLVQYKLYFNISIFKLLYIFFIVQAYASMINRTAKFIDIRIFPEHLTQMVTTSCTLLIVALMLATYPFLFLFFKNTFSRALHEYPDRGFWKLCVTPALFFIIIMIYSSVCLAQTYSNPDMFLLFLLILLTGLITYYLTLRIGVDLSNSIQARTEMEGQLALQAQHYRQLTETIEHTRTARHDLRHHLSVISAYLKKDDKTGLQAYLDEYIGGTPDESVAPYCDNYAVDAVARHYLTMAKDAGAEIDVRMQVPQDARIPDSDLCIVFGNIFENAAESCIRQESGRRSIHARCETIGGRMVFTVDNSGSESKGRSKPDRYKGGGVGLGSVQAVVEKYNGILEFGRDRGVYKTSVILLIPDA